VILRLNKQAMNLPFRLLLPAMLLTLTGCAASAQQAAPAAVRTAALSAGVHGPTYGPDRDSIKDK
jgi:hypothetical protein